MAPEVVNPQGKGYNFKVDIWSVGCVVLEMWAGMRPWQGDEAVAVMFKVNLACYSWTPINQALLSYINLSSLRLCQRV
jgi:serine/threonine protein kinase